MSCHAACLFLVFWCVSEVYSPLVMESFDGPARLVGNGIADVLSPGVVIPCSSSAGRGHLGVQAWRDLSFLLCCGRILRRPGLAPVSLFHGVGLRIVACSRFKHGCTGLAVKGSGKGDVCFLGFTTPFLVVVSRWAASQVSCSSCFLVFSPPLLPAKRGWTNATTTPWPPRSMLPGQCQKPESRPVSFSG